MGYLCEVERAKVMESKGNELLEKFMSYNFPQLKIRFINKLSLSESESSDLFEDLKKWMYLCTVSSVALSPPKMIDEAWHNFLLFTMEYKRFCDEYCGRFIHHFPFDGVPPDAKRKQTRLNTKNEAIRAGLVLSKYWHPTAEGGEDAECNRCCAPSGYEATPY